MTTSPKPVDVFVGQRLRAARVMANMSQEQLGAAVALTFQQIQKYEKGANRISSSRLDQFAKILNRPISWFFDEQPNGGEHNPDTDIVTRMMAIPAGASLARDFVALKSTEHRNLVAKLAHIMAERRAS